MEIDMTRTDAHRPSAIKPSDYEFVAIFVHDAQDAVEAGWLQAQAQADFNRHMECHPGAQFSQHSHGGVCMVCGNSNALTTAVFYHEKTNSYVRMGQDCASKMDMGVDSLFRRARTEAEALRLARAGKLKAQGILREAGLEQAWAIAQETDEQVRRGYRYEEATICDIVIKLIKYGSISEAQTGFIRKLLVQIDARAQRQADYMARHGGSQHVGVIGDRHSFSVKIRFVKSFETAFGMLFIHVMDDAQGNVIVYKGSKELGEKGQSLSLVATVSEHGEREGIKQTIIKRPKVA
jgi:hypothetical protein